MRDISDRLGGNTQRQHWRASLWRRRRHGAAPADDDVAIAEGDFTTFERKLGEIETAYSEENLAKLRRW